MSRGRTTSGDATLGQDRPKSGEFEAMAAPQGGPDRAVRVSAPPPAVESSDDIDSAWDAPDSKRTNASSSKVAPKPVISIGPPASDFEDAPIEAKSKTTRGSAGAANQKKSPQIQPVDANVKTRATPAAAESSAATGGVALLDKRSNPPEALASSRAPSVSLKSHAPSVPPGPLDAPKAVNPEELKKLLTDGPESDFSALDIGTLVSNVMGSQPPPAPTSNTSGSQQGGLAAPSAASEPSTAPDEPAAQPAVARTSAKTKVATTTDAPPSSKGKRRRKKQQITAARKTAAAERSKPASAHLESEWAGDFFSANPDTIAHADAFHESDDMMLDERHLRSLSPEVRARRARYRRWVLLFVVGLLVLLGAAVALKLLRHH